MARMPRLVVPGYPHHITQRGNRRMKTFFGDDDYLYYLELLAEHQKEAGVEICETKRDRPRLKEKNKM